MHELVKKRAHQFLHIVVVVEVETDYAAARSILQELGVGVPPEIP